MSSLFKYYWVFKCSISYSFNVEVPEPVQPSSLRSLAAFLLEKLGTGKF